MKPLVAKPIINNEYWVITSDGKKVGNVLSSGQGFDVRINGSQVHFQNTTDIKKSIGLEFQKFQKPKKNVLSLFSDFPLDTKHYNSVFDIKRKLHLFTKTPNSKCLYAAGWFIFKDNDKLELEYCPKYIFIQRYEYLGPFKTKEEATESINKIS